MQTINITEMTTAFTTNLAEQREALNLRLVELDGERNAVVIQMKEIDRIMASLKGKSMDSVAAPGGRKPMSAEGRENIRRALLARKERLAAANTDQSVTPSEPVVEAPTATEGQREAAQEPVVGKASKKGARRG